MTEKGLIEGLINEGEITGKARRNMNNLDLKKEKLETSLMDSLSSEDGISVIIQESSELFLDSKISEGLLREIPIVRYIFAAKKGFLDIRDYLFVKKIVCFLREANSSDRTLRDEFVSKIRGEKKEKEVGMHLIELIDKSFGIEKAKIIGKMFVLFLKEKVTYEDFIRISEMIVNAYESDLKYFFDTKGDQIGETGDEVEHLISIGFYERGKSGFGSTIMENRRPDLSTFGKILQQVE